MNISVAKVRNLLISIVVVPSFQLKFHNHFCNPRVLILGKVYAFFLFFAKIHMSRNARQVMTFANLHIAFTYMAALEHNFDICLLKLS